jgi:FAD/FMN-containing dehydrogenase
VRVWNGMAATTPALVAQPTSAHQVAAAVGFARDHGLLLGIKGGGHNIAGTAIAEGGLTLDLSRMREVSVDPTPGSPVSVPGACSGRSTRPPRRTGWRPCSGSCRRPAWPG